MQEELAEPALYVKSGCLEVGVFLQDAPWICFTRLVTWFPTGTKERKHTKALSRELH